MRRYIGTWVYVNDHKRYLTHTSSDLISGTRVCSRLLKQNTKGFVAYFSTKVKPGTTLVL
ncbi:hypothetical protein Hanom_Chr05g00464241 [Helianthus anomalus]